MASGEGEFGARKSSRCVPAVSENHVMEVTGEPAQPVSSADAMAIYALAVEMADRVSARRATANSFFFTIQAGLAVALGAFAIDGGGDAGPDRFVLFLSALAGSVIAAAWWMLLRSYRDLNRAKFAVIVAIEREHLPIALFDREWRELQRDPVSAWRSRYAELGDAERVVPIVFYLLYVALAIYVVVA